ncbi:hypothetical protein [Mesorhizobium sp. WSM3866]|uniref:hypothetical protein n=1 Tax=Mesorhizobium sp. WSM3866 TaxID=422271 RepID=UPI001140D15A|nr:hypothetical protein [Mesorhizobium sp. WSM3866]
MKSLPAGIFKPVPSRTEAKTDATTRIARQIVDLEATARSVKTERLRAARLAQASQAPAITPARKPGQKRKNTAS